MAWERRSRSIAAAILVAVLASAADRTDGSTFEKVSDLESVTQLDKLDNDKVVIVLVAKDKTTSLKTIKLP